MALTFELDLDIVQVNQYAKYLGPKVSVRTRRQTHTGRIALPEPLRWPVTTVLALNLSDCMGDRL